MCVLEQGLKGSTLPAHMRDSDRAVATARVRMKDKADKHMCIQKQPAANACIRAYALLRPLLLYNIIMALSNYYHI